VRTVRNTQIHCGQSVPHSKLTHVSATEPNRLMLCGETVAVCCENRTEHTYTLWAVRTSQETHHVSATEPSRLMLCGETVAVCSEHRTEHRDTLWVVRTSQETHRYMKGWGVKRPRYRKADTAVCSPVFNLNAAKSLNVARPQTDGFGQVRTFHSPSLCL
jgi:hypothetical protein